MSSVEHSTEIGADADQLSVSRSASNSQSAVGLGTVSGRAIQAVGELALRGLETVNIAMTLQRISSRMRGTTTLSMQSADLRDLLELQRIGLYPKYIRRKAWSLLYLVLERGYHADILSFILGWAAVELQLFLRQLVSHNLTSWSNLPKDASELRDPQSRVRVSDCIHHILLAILQHDAYIVNEIYDIYKFARALSAPQATPSVKDGQRSRDSLTRFFDQWIRLYAIMKDDDPVPLTMRCMVHYLSEGGRSRLRVVMDHLKAAIAPFAYLPDDGDEDPLISMQEKIDEVSRRYLNLGHSEFSVLHPTAPFLAFVRLLSQVSKASILVFTSAGFVDLIVRLHDIRFYHIIDQPAEVRRQMDDLCQSVIDILSPGTLLRQRSRRPSLYTYPSQSASRAPSTHTAPTLPKQASTDSLSSVRAVFRVKMPPPPPPPSPPLLPAPPPSPSASFYQLTARSEDTFVMHEINITVERPSMVYSDGSSDDLLLTPTSLVPTHFSVDSSPSNYYADGAETDCATLGVKTLSSRFPSRRSTNLDRAATFRNLHTHSPDIFDPQDDLLPSPTDPTTPPTNILGLDLTLSPSTIPLSLDPERPLPPLPDPSDYTLVSAETLNGHSLPSSSSDSGSVSSYFDDFESAELGEAFVAWDMKVSRTRRLARRVVLALRAFGTTDEEGA
ncbi:hypothetical protein EIP91_008576 [Steccherinum ochraceum]|uniref:Uncharacterized protein n=1 Tax=Steccherinum ochraceum TaxID=92696 RepID=A0A4R0R5C1_9APHY|nr:hypothetical protein EIP91_008576 [Steccherinum ochraceum]